MINPTQMHRLPAGLDQQGRFQTAGDDVRIKLSDAEQAKLADAVEWFLFASTPDSDSNTDGMGYASPTPSDVMARDDVRRAERVLRIRAALIDLACWVGGTVIAVGMAALPVLLR